MCVFVEREDGGGRRGANMCVGCLYCVDGCICCKHMWLTVGIGSKYICVGM